MYFDLSKPQKLLQQSVRDFCKREVPSRRVRELMGAETSFDRSLWTEIADQGWIGLHLGEEFDGLGLGLIELAVVAEEFGRACLPGPWLSTNWAATLMAAAGGPMSTELVPRAVAGTAVITVAILEEAASWGADASSFDTTLGVDADRLTGRKDLVLEAGDADHFVCIAEAAGELCLAVVPTAGEGIQITATPGMDITRRVYQCDLNQVPIGAEQILARGNAAQQTLEHSLRVASIAVCAEMLGLQQWMLEATVEYAKTRKQFDRVIGSYQAVQHKCTDMLLLTESARSAVWYAAWTLQEGNPDSAKAVAVAKAYVSDAAREVGNLAVQAHGGIGFTWEHDLHLYYKRAKADEYLFGDATHHREQLAKQLLC